MTVAAIFFSLIDLIRPRNHRSQRHELCLPDLQPKVLGRRPSPSNRCHRNGIQIIVRLQQRLHDLHCLATIEIGTLLRNHHQSFVPIHDRMKAFGAIPGVVVAN